MLNPQLAFKFWDLYEKGKMKRFWIFKSFDDPFWDGPVKKYGWHKLIRPHWKLRFDEQS